MVSRFLLQGVTDVSINSRSSRGSHVSTTGAYAVFGFGVWGMVLHTTGSQESCELQAHSPTGVVTLPGRG